MCSALGKTQVMWKLTLSQAARWSSKSGRHVAMCCLQELSWELSQSVRALPLR